MDSGRWQPKTMQRTYSYFYYPEWKLGVKASICSTSFLESTSLLHHYVWTLGASMKRLQYRIQIIAVNKYRHCERLTRYVKVFSCLLYISITAELRFPYRYFCILCTCTTVVTVPIRSIPIIPIIPIHTGPLDQNLPSATVHQTD